MASVSSHTFKLIVDGDQGIRAARQFRNAFEKELGALGKPGKAADPWASIKKGIGAVAGGLGLYVGIREIAAFNAESMALGRAQADARGALISTIGSADRYEQAIAKAREETRNMVSEQGLAVGINAILSMKLAANAEEAAKLSMAGNILSNVYAGAGATMEKYYRLLAGGSPVLYDNFGLTREMVNQRQAEIQAANDVSAAEAKLQAIRELTLESAGRYNQSLSTETVQMAQAKAAMDDFKAAWGTMVNQILVGSNALGTATNALRSLEAVVEGNDRAQRDSASLIMANSDSYREYQRAMVMAGLQARAFTKDQFEAIKAAGRAAETAGEYAHETRRLEMAAANAAAAELAAASATSTYISWAEQAQAVQEALGDEYLTSADKLEQYVNELARMSMYGFAAPAMTAEFGPQANTAFMDQLAMDRAKRRRLEREEEAKNAEKAAEDWQRANEQAVNELRSTIEGVLKPTLDQVWTPPEGSVPRIDEAARRLATVATSGFGSEWLDQLNTQFAGMSFWQPIADAMSKGDEGALKAAATQLLSGPAVSQLWDINVIKQKVRDELARQNAQEQIINTVMQELSAEGLRVGAGQIQMAMGVSPVMNMLMGDPTQLGPQLQSTLSAALSATNIDPAAFAPVSGQVAKAMAISIRGGLGNVQWSMMLAEVMQADFNANLEATLRPMVIPIGQQLGDWLAEGAAESSFSQMIIAAIMEQMATALEG
jgi:hypothetical protein